MLSRKSKPKRPSSNKVMQRLEKISMFEFCVVLLVIGAMLGMAFPVWANVRKNAYNARARQNREYAEQAVMEYWNETGYKGSGYEGFTADRMNDDGNGMNWVDGRAFLGEASVFGDLPNECFASILIIREGHMSADEIEVAAISTTGTVFYTCFRKSSVTNSGQLVFGDFRVQESQQLQAQGKKGTDWQ